MSAIVDKEFDRNLRPRERHRGFPKLALRQRSAEHPMIMFFLVAAAAFTAMAVMPPAGAAFATFEAPLVSSGRLLPGSKRRGTSACPKSRSPVMARPGARKAPNVSP